MKKIILFLFALMFVAPSYATTMCATDDTIAIVMDPKINGKGYTSVKDLYEWRVNFEYGTVFGIAACVGTNELTNGELIDTDGTLIVGGEMTGDYCWCRMLHPLKSQWTYVALRKTVGSCSTPCSHPAGYCGNSVNSGSTFRSKMFSSVLEQ